MLSFRNSHAGITGKFVYDNNYGTFLISTSKIQFFSTVIIQNCRESASVDYYPGGAVTSMDSTIWFLDSIMFVNNYSKDVGGALCAIES